MVLIYTDVAIGADPLSLTMTGYLVVTETENGKLVKKLHPLTENVMPGHTIQYDINGKNESDQPLKNVIADGKIPQGTTYNDGSAVSSIPATILFSIDNGNTFEKPPIVIKVKQPDGKEIEKTVDPDQYTNIRFIIKQLDAGKNFVGSYEVTVK